MGTKNVFSISAKLFRKPHKNFLAPPDLVSIDSTTLAKANGSSLNVHGEADRPDIWPVVTSDVLRVANMTIGLSASEGRILRQFVDGSSSRTIAHDLAVDHKTVKVCLRGILRKLKASNRTRTALSGIEHEFDQSTVLGQFGARSSEAIAAQSEASSVMDEARDAAQ
jgi:DNA-binding CsgD family transcriptional regulator